MQNLSGRLAIILCTIGLLVPVVAPAQVSTDTLSVLYTGKSLGVLGFTRFQNEHDLLIRQAIDDSIDFKIVSHACYRSQGISIFLPSDEPENNELEQILEQRADWVKRGMLPALRSDHVLMFQDPVRSKTDMIDMILKGDRTRFDFPDFVFDSIVLYETSLWNGMGAIIVVQENAVWPDHLNQWIVGEVNRIDFGESSRLFELPLNYGVFGVRARVLQSLTGRSGSDQIIVDLGHRNGDFNISPEDRANLDLKGLVALGYQSLVPYEFELSLGMEVLQEVHRKHPDLTLLASNLSTSDTSLLHSNQILNLNGIKVGMIGLVDPELEKNLPGFILNQFRFIPFLDAARKQVRHLQQLGTDIILACSNMSAASNAILAEKVPGIHAVLANLSGSGVPYPRPVNLDVHNSVQRRIDRSLMVAEGFDYGIAVGEMKLMLRQSGDKSVLDQIQHQIHAVHDQMTSYLQLVDTLKSGLELKMRPKGDLMFPAFEDIVDQKPELAKFDAVTRTGRVSKPLWENFLARLVRSQVPAEISMLREIPSFLPLIGKLHEREVRSWLWFEDELVICDMKGSDIIRLLETPDGKQLVTSGIKSFVFNEETYWMVMGRFIGEDVYYRIATTNVIYNGVLNEFFADAIRVHQKFTKLENGTLRGNRKGTNISVRDFVLAELKRIRSLGKGKEHHRNIASILPPDPPFEKLLSFSFMKPTLWTTLNRNYRSSGYDAVPESRINADNSFVIGLDGGFMLTYDANRSAWDLGSRLAFARQSSDRESTRVVTENMDEMLFNLSYRWKGKRNVKYQPLARVEYDSEFTATINSISETTNPRQKILRGKLGVSKKRSPKWPNLELGLTIEKDYGQLNTQYGMQYRSLSRFPLDEDWRMLYTVSNDINYYFPSQDDTDRQLSLKLNSVHQLLIPLFGHISLSVAADVFIYRGKLNTNNRPGASMLYRVGITYDRIWKPKFQPLF